MNPNGLVAAASITSRGDSESSRHASASSLASEMLTALKTFS